MNLLIGLLIYAFVFVGGCFLVWRGLWHRAGNTPHCRRCEYDLTASTETCPECGADLARPKAIRRGTRQRRLALAGLGAVLLLWGAATLFISFVMTDWVRQMPTSVLIAAGEYGISAERVLKELQSRVDADRLPPKEQQALAAKALDWYRTNPMEMVDLINGLLIRDALTHDQVEQVWATCTQIQLRARPEVNLGDAVPVETRVMIGLPSVEAVGPLEVLLSTRLLGPDGPIETASTEPFDFGNRFFFSMSGGLLAAELELPPGTHTLATDVDVVVRRPRRGGEGYEPVWQGMHQDETTVIVRAEGAPDVLERVSDPEFANALRAAITPQHVWADDERVYFEVHITGETPFEVPVAMHVDPLTPEGFNFVTWSTQRDQPLPHPIRWVRDRVDPLPETCRVRIVGNRAYGIRLHHDPTYNEQYWEGEIVYDPIPVEPGKPDWAN